MRLIIGSITNLDIEEAPSAEGDMLLTFWDVRTPKDKFQTVMAKDSEAATVIGNYIAERKRKGGDYPGRNQPSGVHVE